jgi:hypothetical protein
MEIGAAAQPATRIERWFANEYTHDTWELERVRTNKLHTAAESCLNGAGSSAARIWNRIRKEIGNLQIEHALDLVQKGVISSQALNVVNLQEHS